MNFTSHNEIHRGSSVHTLKDLNFNAAPLEIEIQIIDLDTLSATVQDGFNK